MTSDEHVAAVKTALSPDTYSTFAERVRQQAETIADAIETGKLDNADFAIGLELETYVVDSTGELAIAPVEIFGGTGRNPELGVHNVELNTAPDTLDGPGIRRQVSRLQNLVESIRQDLPDDTRLALDAMWTVPPDGGSLPYLSDGAERDGVFFATNMHDDARYYALDNEILNRAEGSIELSVPGAEFAVPSILAESLAASIQPHLQVPDASVYPQYHNVAIRTLGPVLALGTNSPFLPADCYGDTDGTATASDIDELLAAMPHEHRVPVFERIVNAGLESDNRKVRVPGDIERPTDVLDRVVADVTYAPHLFDHPPTADSVPAAETPYADRIPEYRLKRGTYWRWVRAVIGGDVPTGHTGETTAPANDTGSIRLEYRSLPTQPTVRDTVGMQALVVGLLRGLVTESHPLIDLPWSAARDAFYAAVDDGLEADLDWVTAAGERTTDPETIFGELFEYARRGLSTSGLDDPTIDWVLDPIETRWSVTTTPSQWQRNHVRSRVSNGATLPEAIRETKRSYLQYSESTDTFVEWL